MFLVKNIQKSIFFLCLFISCSKNTETTKNITNQLFPFSITVYERIPNRAIINWTPSLASNADTAKYKVYINNKIVDSNLTKTYDTLKNLLADSIYFGKVVAYTKVGDTISASFYLDKCNAFIYLATNSKLTSFNAYPSLNLNTIFWSKPIGDMYAPVISHDTLFLSTNTSGSYNLSAYNANTGNQIWIRPNDVLFTGPPTYNNGRLYARTDQGITAFSALNGQILWSYQNIDRDLSTIPVIDNNKVFIGNGTDGGHISAINLLNGSLMWDVKVTGQMCIRPLVTHNLVIIGTTAAMIYALDQSTGNIVWAKNLATYSGNFGANLVSPILVNNTVLVHHPNEGLYALNILTGATVWIYGVQDPHVSPPATGNGCVYFSYTNGPVTKIVAINSITGQLVWEKISSEGQLGYLIFAKNKLYLAEYYNIQMVDAFTGNLLGHVLNASYGSSQYAVRINDSVFYNANHGNYK